MSEKTEKPTHKRLRQARDEGQIPRSAEVSSTSVFLAVFAFIAFGGPYLWECTHAFAETTLREAFTGDLAGHVPMLFESMVFTLAVAALPVLACAALTAILVGVVQSGGLFSIHPLLPNMDHINPAKGLERIFSKRTAVTLVTLMLKFALIGGLGYRSIEAALPELLRGFDMPPTYMALTGSALVIRLFAGVSTVFIVMSVLDYALQRHWHIDGMKQDKHEVKQDRKETDGDPELKARRKSMAMKIVFGPLENSVKKADVVVVNPTHIAVAIAYLPGQTPLPMVVAKGVDDMALAIRKIAQQHGIPVVRDVPLARSLHESNPVDSYIGTEHFEPVAELLAWVKSLKTDDAG